MNDPTRTTTTYTDVDTHDAEQYAAAHDGWGVYARYFHSRLHAVTQQLAPISGGCLLDVGCGPGMLVRHLMETRPGDFKVHALDQSPAMIRAAEMRLRDTAGVEFCVGAAEDMPLPDASFDVVLAMGVLEYADVPRSLAEISRVTRPGGVVVATMLNPHSFYRLVEWGLFWPGLRLLGRLEEAVGVPAAQRHGCAKTGIRALTVRGLGKALRAAGLEPQDLVYFDLTPTVPPLDRLARRMNRRWRDHPETTIGSRMRGVFGTAYLVTSRKAW